MNRPEDKQLDQLAKKIIGKTSLESPSFDFTEMVMSKVEALDSKNITITYKPLIPRTGWVFISMMVIGVIAYVIFGSDVESLGWINQWDFSALPSLKNVNIFSGITIPKTLTYAVVLFGLMLSIQIWYMKRHLNRSFES